MNTEANKTTGKIIRELRENSKITQSELARRLRKPQSYVSKIESGERSLRAYELIPFAQALGMPTHVIMEALERALTH